MQAKAKKEFPVRLDILDSKGSVRHTCEYVKEKIVMGRILSADLRIDEPRVSRIHALLEVRGERAFITDLASAHGTFVNGKKVVESEVKPGDTFRLGVVDIQFHRGSGRAQVDPVPSEYGEFISDGDETRIDIDRAALEKAAEAEEAKKKKKAKPKSKASKKEERRGESLERRQKDVFPDERRLDQRRSGERRIEQRKEDRRKEAPAAGGGLEGQTERRDKDRRVPLDYERRVGERRKGERRVFDITSLERRIEDRRRRKSDDDLLPEELEAAFDEPEHARELEITVLWGDHILDVSNYTESTLLTVGESPKNHYIIPSVGIPDIFPLIRIDDDGTARLSFTDEMKGTIRTRDKIYKLEEIKDLKYVEKHDGYYRIQLRQDNFAKIRIGNINFFLLYVKPAQRIRPAPIFEKDKLLLRTTLGSALLMLLMLIGLSFVPEPKPVTVEMMPERFARIVIRKKPKIKPPKEVKKAEQTQVEGSKAAKGAKAPKPEGKPKTKKVVTKKKPPKTSSKKAKVSPKTKRPKARKKPRKVVNAERAKSVGLLKAFKDSNVKSNLKNLLKPDPGFNVFGKGRPSRSQSRSGLEGAGQGLKGVNVGGGGKRIGISGPSTKGLGGAKSGIGRGEGVGLGRLGKKGEALVSVVSENVQVLAGLPKDVINAVVQRHRNEIRQCYEAARQRNPNLRGKVVIAFDIQPNGIVSRASVRESTVGSPSLSRCIVSRVKSWRFPKPEAPVVTEVRAYPFYLNPGN